MIKEQTEIRGRETTVKEVFQEELWKALRSKIRWFLLLTLYSCKDKVMLRELKKKAKLGKIGYRELSKHLSILCAAGLVRELVKVSELDEPPTPDNRYFQITIIGREIAKRLRPLYKILTQ